MSDQSSDDSSVAVLPIVEDGAEEIINQAEASAETREAEDEGPKDNPDDLVELRGEGRYFGHIEEKSKIVCSNCHRRGHIRAHCKVVVCHACGMVDDHYETQCPQSIVCSNCGEKGHFQSQCKERRKHIYCNQCNARSHTSDRCPTIWRSYLTLRSDKKLALPPKIYCYNCAGPDHYGDDCTLQRQSRTPNINGSAFTGQNLPKELRNTYQSRMRHSKKRHYESLDYGESKRPRTSHSVPNFHNQSNNSNYGMNSYNSNISYNNNHTHKGSRANNGRHQPSKSGTLAPQRGKFANAKNKIRDATRRAKNFF